MLAIASAPPSLPAGARTAYRHPHGHPGV